MELFQPVRLYTGQGAVMAHADRLRALGERCLIVTGGSSARRSGALNDAVRALESLGVEWKLYDRIEQNPSISSCVAGGRMAADFGARFILGIGGGSPLDAAKVIALSAANPELDEAGLYRMRWPRGPLPIALIGTTAGTGSEVTPIAVITDMNGRKNSFRDEKLYASLAFGDPAYTASMPAAVTASTALDALHHCVESALSVCATDLSRAFAYEGARMLLAPLQALAEGRTPDTDTRETLYNASILGGLAISVTGTAMPHALGYYLTESHGVPHGFACAAFMRPLLALTARKAPRASARLFDAIGAGPETLNALVDALRPAHHVRLTDEETEALLPRWRDNRTLHRTAGDVTEEELREILREQYNGKETA